MNVVREEVQDAIDKELEAAIENHGFFNSMHEKIAVMYEEYQEACEEIENAKKAIDRMWSAIRNNLDGIAMQQAFGVAHCAENLAIEAIQLAATARKIVERVTVQPADDRIPKMAEVSE